MSGEKLRIACRDGDIETIRRLLQEGVNPNYKDSVCIPSIG